MKNLKLLILILLVAFTASCKKDKKASNGVRDTTVMNEVTLATAHALDLEPSYLEDLNDIILPNGSNLMDYGLIYDYDWLAVNKNLLPEKYRALLDVRKTQLNSTDPSNLPVIGPQAILNNIILQEQCWARNLVDPAFTADLVKGKQDPQQKFGLAYIYGGKDYTKLAHAADERGKKGCPALLYGVDCSGLTAFLAKQGGININRSPDPYPGTSAADQSLKTRWENALKDAGGDYAKLTVQQFTRKDIALNTTDIKAGDIIYFHQTDENGHAGIVHIGMALKSKDGLRLYNAHGKQSVECESNYGSKRGVRAVKIDGFSMAAWAFDDYGVIRLEAKIAGKWKAFIKCSDKEMPAITLNLDFPADSGGDFKATGSGTDYTGEAINVEINGSYDPKKLILKGEITYMFPSDPTEQRKDSFNASLNYDATDYYTLTKVIDNGGCDAQIKFVNLQSKNAGNVVNSVKPIRVNSSACSHCAIGNKTKN